MKKLVIICAVLAAAYYIGVDRGIIPPKSSPTRAGTTRLADSPLARAIASRKSNVQVQGSGVVKRLLRDDNVGRRHQRFIIQLPAGQTVLIAHNIDLAPRVQSIKVGDRVAFCGEYEWNARGGVLHWTHHDPAGRHAAGWLSHNGRTYQ
jgi:hypothetical protein